jgi:hypothetical protein
MPLDNSFDRPKKSVVVPTISPALSVATWVAQSLLAVLLILYGVMKLTGLTLSLAAIPA